MDIARLKQLAGIGENPHFIQMPNPRKEFALRHHERMKLSMNESKPEKLELKKLAYETKDLAPVLSKDNVEYHYNILSNGYVTTTKKAIQILIMVVLCYTTYFGNNCKKQMDQNQKVLSKN
jgi:hypothetical protein